MQAPNWETLLFRILFALCLGAITAWLKPFGLSTGTAFIVGLGVGVAIDLLEIRIRRAPLRSIVSGSLGLLIGGILGLIFGSAIGSRLIFAGMANADTIRLALVFGGGFIGLLTGLARAEVLNLNAIGLIDEKSRQPSLIKILDTSVLIDGRITDIAESGFVDGTLLLPQFVLHELQSVADSADSAKRNRGRRGLDVVQKLQKMPLLQVEVTDRDFPLIREVDLKLIELAKLRKAKIVTNDFNLNKLATVQGVAVLNINELANALKPVVLPGEAMRVFILKEGKEHNQGVAYLDDGTMVVVDNARRLISKTVDITVTSVLQTTAGKMIFGKYDERQQERPTTERPSGISAAASAGGGHE